MAWCRQKRIHDMIQYWPNYMTPYGVTILSKYKYLMHYGICIISYSDITNMLRVYRCRKTIIINKSTNFSNIYRTFWYVWLSFHIDICMSSFRLIIFTQSVERTVEFRIIFLSLFILYRSINPKAYEKNVTKYCITYSHGNWRNFLIILFSHHTISYGVITHTDTQTHRHTDTYIYIYMYIYIYIYIIKTQRCHIYKSHIYMKSIYI